MKEFNLRNYLYNNPLLKEEKEEVKAKKAKKEDKKPKKSKEEDIKENTLRGYIREKITSILQEAEDEDVDVDVEKDVNVDVEDEIDIDDESIESDIEVKSEVPGEDTDTAAILGLLTKAQSEAESIGDEKLLDQIGNTITYFTRAHIVKSDQTRGAA